MPPTAQAIPSGLTTCRGLHVLGRSYRLVTPDPDQLALVALFYAPMMGPVASGATDVTFSTLPGTGLAVTLEGKRFDFSEPWVTRAPSSALTHALLATESRHLVFHAGAFGRAGRAVMLAGASGLGKSTLIAHLGERGATILSDEFAPLDRYSGSLAPFRMRVGLRAGPRPERAGIDVELPGESKRLLNPDAGPSRTVDPLPLASVVILGTSAGPSPASACPRVRLWLDAEPDAACARLAMEGCELLAPPVFDGLWTAVLVAHPDLRRIVEAMRTDPKSPASLMRVQYEDLDPPDFQAAPVLRELSPTTGVMELVKRLSTAQRSRIVDEVFAGDATRLVLETAAAVRTARFFHLRPGRLTETLACLEGLVR